MAVGDGTAVIFGKLNGQLRYISLDTLSEQGANGQSSTFYRARSPSTGC